MKHLIRFLIVWLVVLANLTLCFYEDGDDHDDYHHHYEDEMEDDELHHDLDHSEFVDNKLMNDLKSSVLVKTLSLLKNKNPFEVHRRVNTIRDGILNETVVENSKHALESILFKNVDRHLLFNNRPTNDKFNENKFLEYIMNNIIDSSKTANVMDNFDDSIKFLGLFKKLFRAFSTSSSRESIINEKSSPQTNKNFINYLKFYLKKVIDNKERDADVSVDVDVESLKKIVEFLNKLEAQKFSTDLNLNLTLSSDKMNENFLSAKKIDDIIDHRLGLGVKQSHNLTASTTTTSETTTTNSVMGHHSSTTLDVGPTTPVSVISSSNQSAYEQNNQYSNSSETNSK